MRIILVVVSCIVGGPLWIDHACGACIFCVCVWCVSLCKKYALVEEQ